MWCRISVFTFVASVVSWAVAMEPSSSNPDEELITGDWQYVLSKRGRTLEPVSQEAAEAILAIRDGKMKRTVVGIPVEMEYSLQIDTIPKQINIRFVDNGKKIEVKGVFEVSGNVLILKLASKSDQPRPETISFDPDEDGVEYSVLGRVGEADESRR